MPLFYLVVSILLIILLTTRFNIHAFLSLFIVAVLYGFASGMPLETILSSVSEGFGSTLGKIGIIIIFGIIIGTFLENSGGAFALADFVLKVVGQKRVSLAMGIMGYIISIPVFADSGFLLVSSLCKSLAKKANISLSGPAIALALGLMSSHVMVPPTPGPVAAAGILDADLGLLLLIGIPISFLAVLICILFASTYAAKFYIEPLPALVEKKENQPTPKSPGAFKASLPILVPLILIVLRSIEVVKDHDSLMYQLIFFTGEPVIALFIGMVLAVLLPEKLKLEMLSTEGWVGRSLKDASSIILITGAGGIFGKVLQNSGIAEWLGGTLVQINIGIWLPFLIAAMIKTAQGSSTVSIITTASILSPMMISLGFDSDIAKTLVVIAIGAGAAVVSHANDSFFWVVTQLCGMDMRMGLRIYTLGSLVLGVSAAILVFITSLILL